MAYLENELNVAELHKILATLIEQGKGDYKVRAEFGYVALYDDFGVNDEEKIVGF
jgi:hypothetical protein